MASTNGIIFPESTADIIANPVDICNTQVFIKDKYLN
jgi:hypothetical protein